MFSRKPLPTIGRTGLILLSHGSSRSGATDALLSHAETIRSRGVFDPVEPAFVNLGSPSLEAAAERCLAAGVVQTVVVPYFLVSGRHVGDDTARRVAEVQARWPDARFVAAEALGCCAGLVDAVVEIAATAKPIPSARDRREQAATAFENTPPGAALLIVAHGSPRFESLADVVRVCDAVRERRRYADVRLAFLQHAAPDVSAGVRECLATGVRRLIAVPYFLHAGKHVTSDVPGLLARQLEAHPDVEFLLGEHVGRSPRVTDVVIARAQAALVSPG